MVVEGVYDIDESAIGAADAGSSAEYAVRASLGSVVMKGSAKYKLASRRIDAKETFSFDVDKSKPLPKLQLHVHRCKTVGSSTRLASAMCPLPQVLEDGTIGGPFELIVDQQQQQGRPAVVGYVKGQMTCGDAAEKMKRRQTIIAGNATGELSARAQALERANADLQRKLAAASVVRPPTTSESLETLFPDDNVSQQTLQRMIGRGHLQVATIVSSRAPFDLFAATGLDGAAPRTDEVMAAMLVARRSRPGIDEEDEDEVDRFCLSNGQSIALTLVDDHLETILWRPSAAKILNDNNMPTAAAFAVDRGTQTEDAGHIISVQLAGSPLQKLFANYVEEKGLEEAARVMQLAASQMDHSRRSEAQMLRKASSAMHMLMRSQDEVLTLHAMLKKAEEEKDMLQSRLNKRIRTLEEALAATSAEL